MSVQPTNVVTNGIAVACILTAGSAWSLWYVITTAKNPQDGPESVLLIQPLAVVLVISAIVSFLGLLRDGAKQSEALLVHTNDSELKATHYSNWRRTILIISLPLLAIAISLGGFVLPSATYVMLMGYLMGVKRIGVLLLTGLGLTTVVVLFQQLAGIPLPLWPSS